jgi:hypothetical protein
MPTRHALCEELLKLLATHADADAREKEIKVLLIKDAGEENFKELVDKWGTVSVSAAKPKRCTGTAPELVVDVFLGMTEIQRTKLTDKGIVKIAEQWKDAYSGRVTPTLF